MNENLNVGRKVFKEDKKLAGDEIPVEIDQNFA